jgi:small-conductance mechanosensitive channel
LLGVVSSLKRFVVILVLLVIISLSSVLVFEFINAQVQLSTLVAQTFRILIVLFFGSIILLFITRSKSVIAKHVGPHPATVFQFFMILIVGIVMIFAFLHIFQVSPETLLISGGIVSIVMGLVISTFVGNILSGTLVLMTNPYRVGATVVVNNIPGRVEEITAMVTRIRNDIGGVMVIPNSAIMQGGIIVTRIPHLKDSPPNRLPYSVGDRVYTTYMNAEGVVKELTPFHTKILLDSGKELIFLNTSIFMGTIAVARIAPKSE